MSTPMFGVESEYAIAGMSGKKPMQRDDLVNQFVRVARRQFAHLPDTCSSSGIFLQNGGRFYVDCGLHPGDDYPGVHDSMGTGNLHQGRRTRSGIGGARGASSRRRRGGDHVLPLQRGLQRLGQHLGLPRELSSSSQSFEPSRPTHLSSGHARHLYWRGRIQPARRGPGVLRCSAADAHPTGNLR